MDLKSLYREIVNEHNLYPSNKRKIENPDLVLRGVNPSCGDDIILSLCLKDGVIVDAAFEGSGCAISQASVDMMADEIKGKTIDEAKGLSELFMKMIKGEEKDDEKLEQLEDAAALKDISHMPARVKCAVLGWHTMQEMLEHPEKAVAEKK